MTRTSFCLPPRTVLYECGTYGTSHFLRRVFLAQANSLEHSTGKCLAIYSGALQGHREPATACVHTPSSVWPSEIPDSSPVLPLQWQSICKWWWRGHAPHMEPFPPQQQGCRPCQHLSNVHYHCPMIYQSINSTKAQHRPDWSTKKAHANMIESIMWYGMLSSPVLHTSRF